MNIEAMKLALEALEEPKEHIAKHRRLEAITALRQAIEQENVDSSDIPQERVDETAKQRHEPVVWMYQDKISHAIKFQKHMSDFVDHSRFYETPLYTSPPQRQPEQAQKQEPVASGVIRTLVSIGEDGIKTWKHQPFYTSSPQRQPLTDEEIDKMILANLETWNTKSAMASFARAIEQAHGIKGEEC
jgi:hypothetical protein